MLKKEMREISSWWVQLWCVCTP